MQVLEKIRTRGDLSNDTLSYFLVKDCTIDDVGLYPNIPHEEGLASLRRFLDARTEKKVTTETLLELAEIVLKNNSFQFSEKALEQLRGTAIGTKFAPPYAIIFMANLE